jgi:hypothetical protein
VVLSVDGRQALSGGQDAAVILWGVERKEKLRVFADGHSAPVRCVAFSPDGRRALTGSDDRSVRLWDVNIGRQLHCFDGHGGSVRSVAFSSDGRHALSSGGHLDPSVRLWRVPPPERMAPSGPGRAHYVIPFVDAGLLAGQIRGTVLDGQQPLRDLEIVLKDSKGTAKARTKTGQHGAFVFEKVLPGEYRVSVAGPAGRTEGETPVKMGMRQTVDVTITLSR